MAKPMYCCVFARAVVISCLLIIISTVVSSHQPLTANETESERVNSGVNLSSISTTISASAQNEPTSTPMTHNQVTTSPAVLQTETTATELSTTPKSAPTSSSASSSAASANLNAVNVAELSEAEIIELLSALEEPPSAPSPTFNFSAAAPTFEFSCAADEYQCLFTGECVPYVFVCDHHFVDCADGSDEYPHYRPPANISNHLNSSQLSSAPLEQCSLCGEHSFQCPVTSECIPRGWMCDGQRDCGQTTKGPDTGDEDDAKCVMKEVLLSRDDTDGNLTAALLLEPTKPYVLLYDTSRVISLLKSFINSTVDSIVFHTGTSSADDDAANNSDDNSSQNISQMVTITKDRRICWLDAGQRAIQCISLLQLLVPSASPSPSPPPLTNKKEVDQPDLQISSSFSMGKATEMLLYLPGYLNVASISRVLLDWLTDNWYLLDGSSELLYLCSPPLTACTVIADHSVLSRPLAVELDATEGLLFISRHGDRSRLGPKSLGPAILRCSLDGGNVQTLVDVRIVEPRQLAVDVPQRKLYWVDVYLDILEQVDFDGLNRQQLKLAVVGSLLAWSHVHSIFAQSNKLYLLQSPTRPSLLSTTSTAAAHIPGLALNKTAVSVNLVAIDLESGLFSSHWHSHHHQQQHQQSSSSSSPPLFRSSLLYNAADSSLWKVMKRLCQQCRSEEKQKQNLICVPQFDYLKMQIISASCVSPMEAPTGALVDGDNESNITKADSATEASEAVLVYSRSEPGKISVIGRRKGSKAFNQHYLPITFSGCPTLFDTDPVSGAIVYIDDIAHRLYSQALLQTAVLPLKYLDLKAAGFEQIEGLSIDWLGGNVYLVDSVLSALYVLDLATLRHKRQLIGGLSNPKALVVDPVNRMLFFSQYGANLYEEEPDREHPDQGMFIKRARLDGTRGKIVVKEPYLKFVNALSVDSAVHFLYWCDAFHHRIERVHYDGTGRQLLTAGLRIGIANSLHLDILRKVLYWTELQHGTVQSFDLQTNTTEVVLQEKAPLLAVKLFQQRPKRKKAVNDKNSDDDTLIPALVPGSSTCQHLTLFGKNGHPRCLCADGFIVNPHNSSRCIDVGVSILGASSSLGSAVESAAAVAACSNESPPTSAAVAITSSSGTYQSRCQMYVGGSRSTSVTGITSFACLFASTTVAALITTLQCLLSVTVHLN